MQLRGSKTTMPQGTFRRKLGHLNFSVFDTKVSVRVGKQKLGLLWKEASLVKSWINWDLFLVCPHFSINLEFRLMAWFFCQLSYLNYYLGVFWTGMALIQFVGYEIVEKEECFIFGLNCAKILLLKNFFMCGA